MEVTKRTLDLVKRFEGFRPHAYQDAAGVWTIGYGTTSQAGIGVTVTQGMHIDSATAEVYLKQALYKFAEQILPAFKRKPTLAQFGAMLSLAYNIGPTAFKKSTALKRFNAGDIEGAAEAMMWFNKAGGKKLRGLVRRREAEVEMFLGEDNPVANDTPDALRSTPAESTTMQATGAGVAGVVATGVTAVGALDGTAQIVAVVGLLVVGLAFLWIARERLRKWANGDR